jgi:hypothetical protein
MRAWPKIREAIFVAWYAVIDYSQKIPLEKKDAMARKRDKKRYARLASDGLKEQRLSALRQQKKDGRQLMRGVRERIKEAQKLTHQEMAAGLMPPNYGSICESCGSLASPVSRTKGSFAVEVALWILFCAPGLIYSIWRLSSRESVCPICGGKPIPCGTPRGQEIWLKYHCKSNYTQPQ